ncbi:MAG: MgtC/SapB family protein [Candidatus Limnocylindrales bacterium]
MTFDLVAQLDIVVRLIAATFLGALIGMEREIHEHPAGMRTHLLVALGSAGFTVLSIEAFAAPGADPGRIAAQIVAGVGFLGAGAILKEGATIRGLTTAASLWTVAAVGMAAGAGAWVVAAVTTILVIVSLWPLRLATERFVGRQQHRVHVLAVTGAHGLGEVVTTVVSAGGNIAHLASSRAGDGRLSITLEIRAADAARGATITAAIGDIDGVDLVESKAIGD